MLFGKFERVGREMANPHRLELSDLLAQGSAASMTSLDTRLAGEGKGIRNRGKGVKASSLTGLDDPFRRVLSALGGVLVAVGPVAREPAAVGGDKGINEVLQLPDAR